MRHVSVSPPVSLPNVFFFGNGKNGSFQGADSATSSRMRSCLRSFVAVLFLGLSLVPPMCFMVLPNCSSSVRLKYTILMTARVVFFAMVREIEANSGSLEFDAFGLLFLMFTEASRTTEATIEVNRPSSGLGARSTRDTTVRKFRTRQKVAAMYELYMDELRFIEQGSYEFPVELEMGVPSVFTLCALVVESFFEFPRMERRRCGGGSGDDDALSMSENKAYGTHLTLPDYYLQHFHHQSDGWLSSASARRWEFD